jgi:hypothetical protein
MDREWHERTGFAGVLTYGLVVLQVPYYEEISNREVREGLVWLNAQICPHLKTSDKIVCGEFERSWKLQIPANKCHKE